MLLAINRIEGEPKPRADPEVREPFGGVVQPDRGVPQPSRAVSESDHICWQRIRSENIESVTEQVGISSSILCDSYALQ